MSDQRDKKLKCRTPPGFSLLRKSVVRSRPSSAKASMQQRSSPYYSDFDSPKMSPALGRRAHSGTSISSVEVRHSFPNSYS